MLCAMRDAVGFGIFNSVEKYIILHESVIEGLLKMSTCIF